MDIELSEPEVSRRFSVFISEERERYSGDSNNRVAFSVDQVVRYVRFLGLVYLRYEEIATVVTARFNRISQQFESGRDMTPAESKDLMDGWKYDSRMHLEIESFYLFANILLGKIAQCTEDFFGSARSMTLQSHRKLCKHISKYAAIKELTLPNNWVASAESLLRSVTDYRDDQITHFKKPRALHGTTFNGAGTVGIQMTMLYPKESDTQPASGNIGDLYQEISDYCTAFLDLIHENHGRSRYANNAD